MSAVFPLEDDPRWREHVATAGQTVFPVPYPFQDNADIFIQKIALDGSTSDLSEPEHYELTGAGNPAGGSYTLTAPAAAGEKYRSIGDAVGNRVQSVVRAGRYSSAATDGDLDRALIRDLEMKRDLSRTFKAAYGEQPGRIALLPEGHFHKADRHGNLVDGGSAADIENAQENAASAREDAERAETARDIAEEMAGSVQFPVSYGIEQTLLEAQRMQAQANIGPVKFDTVSKLLSDNILGYSSAGGRVAIATGKMVEAQGYRYEVAATGATDHHVETAAGVKLYVSRSNATVNQYMFGAIGSNSDDTAAFKMMAAFCLATGIIGVALAGSHTFTDTVEFQSSVDLSACSIRVDGRVLKTALRFGTTVPDERVREMNFSCPYSTTNTGRVGFGWVDVSDAIGIEYSNLYACHIYEGLIQHFGIGRRWIAYGTGCVNNTLIGKRLYNNKINEMMEVGDESGWVNENVIIGQQYAHISGEGTNVPGVRHIMTREYNWQTTGGIYSGPNNNVWLKPNLEGNVAEYHVDIQGHYNELIAGRYEASLGAKVNIHSRVLQGSVYNLIVGGYNTDAVTISHTGADTIGNGIVAVDRMHVEGYAGPENHGAVARFSNRGGLGIENPAIEISSGNNLVEGKSPWGARFSTRGIFGKEQVDAHPRVQLTFQNGRFYTGGGTAAPSAYIGHVAPNQMGHNGNLVPVADNVYNHGSADLRIKEIFAAAGAINTSDARQKVWRGELSDPEMRVAVRLSKLIGIYQWQDALAAKGDEARLHCGVTAQEIRDAFAAEGLDGYRYGVLCFDAWGAREAEIDDDGAEISAAVPAGDRYGVRYDQLWAFVAAGFEARLAAVEALVVV